MNKEIFGHQKIINRKIDFYGSFFYNKVKLKSYIERSILGLIHEVSDAYRDSNIHYFIRLDAHPPEKTKCTLTLYFDEFSFSTVDSDYRARRAFKKAFSKTRSLLLEKDSAVDKSAPSITQLDAA